MQRRSQQHPAGADTAKANTDTFIGFWKLKTGLKGSLFERFQYRCTIGVEIIGQNRETYFTICIFCAEVCNEVINGFAFATAITSLTAR